jgi:hypothetical protein
VIVVLPLKPVSIASLCLIQICLCACNIFSGDIKESNELGEWVVAKPQTARFKKYVLDETESIAGLEEIVKEKEKYYMECLNGKERTSFMPAGGDGDWNFKEEQYTETCSKDLVNRERFSYSAGSQLTLTEAQNRLLLARKLLSNNTALDEAVKGVVWRGLRKEIGKEEEKISDWEYWCLNPSLSSGLKKEWKKLLSRNFVLEEDPSNPDAKMYARLHERICSMAWSTPG